MNIKRSSKRGIRVRIGILELPIAPMIDVVFLLLLYFMVSATLQKQEADISFSLPGRIQQDEAIEMPDEQIVQILANGQALVNDYPYDSPEAPRYWQLETMLNRFREASESNLVEARITLAPEDKTAHEMVVKVMDACSHAGIESVTFAFAN
ncbi:MAG: hypothetical protein CMI17_05105 [Opitutaceae bacterium]|nr:hypothetical protein [Opitutaceae bacterium]|tara:strand:- start:955 stop:1410 length:456 start_codon:yes stop_codon:yes gene_type:complete